MSTGRFGFLCAQNRATIQATKMLAALSVYVGTWALLSILAISSPILIGGDSASERFSELAPVISLSSPALWTALRHVQILLEILDTMLGIISSAEKLLGELLGVWDNPHRCSKSIKYRHTC